ncbi:hypothetical protein [Novosphingobium sp.]|uniref:hypothetical protein n=1 Tax=Novosphingobium sp. TaxID=1874826 RepID=UPI00261132EF|nr:hypothetical protein [Novosphingobium sp.]
MTFLLILGAVAGLYMLALLFRLASYALPVYTGIGCAFLLLRHDYGHLAAIAGGLSAGISTLLLGQYLIALVRSPLLRSGIALLFAIPAAIAGFQAAHALGSLATDDGALLAVFGSIAALATSFSAWRSVTMPRHDTPVPANTDDSVSGHAYAGRAMSTE